MAKIRSVKFNALMNTLLTASNMLVSLITIPYVTRILSVERLGDVSFAQSVSTWVSALCLVGINVYGVRECAKVRDDEHELARVVRELLTIITITTAVSLTGYAIAIVTVPSFASLAPLMWMFLVGTLMLSYGVEWFYQGIEQYSYITARSVVFKVAALVATILLVRRPEDYLVYGGILALVTCGNNLLNLLRLNKLVDIRHVRDVNIRRHFRPLAAFGAQSIAQAVYLSFDSTLLGILASGNYQVGLYQLATKLKAVMFQVLNAVLGVFIPRLSHHLAVGDDKAFGQLLRTGFGITINVCVAIAFYLGVFAGPVVIFISGESFAEAALPVRIIGIVNLISCLSYFIGLCILTPLGRERQLAMSNMVGVPLSMILNFLLDPVYGAVGAASALLVSEVVILSVQVWCSRDVLSRFVRPLDVMRVLASCGAGTVLAIVVAWVVDSVIPSSTFAIVAMSFMTFFIVDVSAAYLLGDPTARKICNYIRKKVIHGSHGNA